MSSGRDEIVVAASRAKLLAAALASAFFVIIGAGILVFAPDAGLGTTILGSSAVIFFGICCAYALRRLVRPRPALVINDEGIFDNASLLGVGLIHWHEIAEMRERKFQGQTFLGIVPRNLESVLSRLPAWKRAALRANMALGMPAINIPQAILPMKISELSRELGLRYGRFPDDGPLR